MLCPGHLPLVLVPAALTVHPLTVQAAAGSPTTSGSWVGDKRLLSELGLHLRPDAPGTSPKRARSEAGETEVLISPRAGSKPAARLR